jgi:hypothetical protein
MRPKKGGHREEGTQTSLPRAGFEPRVGYCSCFISAGKLKPKVLVRPEFDLSLRINTGMGRGGER